MQTREFCLPVLQVGKLSTSKLIHFSSHPAVFGFWASFLPDDITLNPANKKIDQSFWFSHWLWWCCSCYFRHRAAYFLYQTCSCWYSYLSSRYSWVIAASEVHKLLTRFHDILDTAKSKQVVIWLIYQHIFLILLPGSAMTSRLPLCTKINDTVPCREDCLYGCISWPLAKVYQQSLLQLSQSSTP